LLPQSDKKAVKKKLPLCNVKFINRPCCVIM